MGRPRWTTPEQDEFFDGYTGQLEEQKLKNSLTSFYNSIAQEFLVKWPATVIDEDIVKAADTKKNRDKKTPEQFAVERRTRVSSVSVSHPQACPNCPPASSRVVQTVPQTRCSSP